MPLSESTNVMEELPAVTPSQEMSSQHIKHIDNPDNANVESAIGSPCSPLGVIESAETSTDRLGEERNETAITNHQYLDPTVPDQNIDDAVNDTQVRADKELDNEAITMKEEIQQLHHKIEELRMLHRRPPMHPPLRAMRPASMLPPTIPMPPVPMSQNDKRVNHSGVAGFLFGRPRKKRPKLLLNPNQLSGTNAKDTDIPKRESFIPKLNRVPWKEFQDYLELDETGDRFAIDVLVGEPNVMLDFSSQEYVSTLEQLYDEEYGEGSVGDEVITANTGATASNQRKATGKPTSRSQGPLPERIRINSKAILKILGKVLQEDLSDDLEPVLMMRPFRALIRYKDEIRKWKENLEVKFKDSQTKPLKQDANENAEAHGNNENATDMGNGGQGENLDDNSKRRSLRHSKRASKGRDLTEIDGDFLTNSKEALDDLKCLVEFIDTDLEDKIAYLASDECQKVVFSDIWHLFKPGDFVVSRDTKQAYRVIQVKYSTHSRKQPSTKHIFMFDVKSKLQNSPITVQCVHIDFDGDLIGPVSQNIDFYRFDGEKNIRSLEIIPLRLAKTSNLRETLVKRGSKFIEVCDTQRRGVPMHYSGLELETQEEIDSQVVIDFEEAIATNDVGGKRRTKGWTVDKLILEMFANMLKEEKSLLVTDIVAKWKPALKHVDEDEDDDSADESDASSSGSDFTTRRYRRASNKKCIPECCSNENVHDDVYVEHNRSKEFIQSQFREQLVSSERIPSLAIAPRPFKEATEDENYITDDERLIISYRVFGFILRSRKWAKLDLSDLGPMKGQNTFDLLVLPSGHREMVESLVTQHFLDKASSYDENDEVDIVRGKGKGLILLLHGAPGVGKTTTAECVATYFHKPLFQITCGDLGSTADVVESRLETNFALASRWGCILLIDEADVFLEARQTENFDRNSLVAVFLRTLEYYTGILFLTTNRVGTFDEAFTSRIHISLYYPPLSQSSTLAVFQVNLKRIQARFEKKKKRGEANLEIDERSINEFILRHYERNREARWNGRQIRNACQTALALAEFEAQKLANPAAGGRSVTDVAAMSKTMINVRLTSKHFRDVARSYLAFMRYLREVHGVSAAQQAKNFRLRHDRYGIEEPPSLLSLRQRGFAEERGPSYGQRCESGGAGSSRGQHRQQGRASTYRQPRQGNYMEDEEDLDEYGYDEEDIYNQESGHDPRQYDEDELDFEVEPLYEQEDEKNPDLENEQSAYGYAEESEDDNDFNQSEYDQEAQVKPRVRPGPSQRRRREQLPARGTGRVRAMVGGRGAGSSLSQRISNRDGHASIGRGKTSARGQGHLRFP